MITPICPNIGFISDLVISQVKINGAYLPLSLRNQTSVFALMSASASAFEFIKS
jgi:hypothetical protein